MLLDIADKVDIQQRAKLAKQSFSMQKERLVK